MLSYLTREREKCISKILDAQTFKAKVEEEKASWAQGVEL